MDQSNIDRLAEEYAQAHLAFIQAEETLERASEALNRASDRFAEAELRRSDTRTALLSAVENSTTN